MAVVPFLSIVLAKTFILDFELLPISSMTCTLFCTKFRCQQCGSPLPEKQPIQAFLEFDTAWSPPIPVIEKLASMFPDHAFELKYFEGGMGFSGHARWSEGAEQFHHSYEYSGPRGG
jgi:hypothetical protein